MGPTVTNAQAVWNRKYFPVSFAPNFIICADILKLGCHPQITSTLRASALAEVEMLMSGAGPVHSLGRREAQPAISEECVDMNREPGVSVANG